MRPLNDLLGAQEKTWIRRIAFASAGLLFAAMQLNAQETSAPNSDEPKLNSAITKKWSMVIRPGAVGSEGQAVPSQLVEFEYDPADSRVVGAPEVFALHDAGSPGVAVAPAVITQGVQPSGTLVPPAPQPCLMPSCTTGDASSVDPLTMAKLYDKMYDLVGFSRAEYRANPSYRDEAVIQMLLNKPIPKTVNNDVNVNDNVGLGFGGLGGWGAVDGYLGDPRFSFPVPTAAGTLLYPYSSPYYMWQNYPNTLHRNVYSPWLSRYPFGNPGRYYY